MKKQAFNHWFSTFQQQALALNERRLVLLVGDNTWAASLLEQIGVLSSEQLPNSRCFIYGDNPTFKATMATKRFRDKLGSESDYVVFSDSQLNIDALAALSGTLVAGGVLFLVMNDYSQIENSYFLKRFFRLISENKSHVIIEQHHLQAEPFIEDESTNESESKGNKESLTSSNKNAESLPYHCKNPEQVQAVEAIIKVVTGRRKRPFVLTADRGRGKSSALAIACGQLLANATKDNPLHIVITAADYNSLEVFYKQLSISLPTARLVNNQYISEFGRIEFIAVDQLIKQDINASLVLVDEAAAIPVYLLEQLVVKYHRMVFASTVHGYEGAGRGFTLKFKQKLDVICPKWRQQHMHQPIRYCLNDPLEQLIFDGCLLNAELGHAPSSHSSLSETTKLDLESLTFKQVDAKTLATNEKMLSQVVSVLVTAHYQTKPSDVKMLLDNPNMQLVCLMSKQKSELDVVAVALLISEGKSTENIISTTDVSAIENSQRRLKNHFTPQSLLTQCGEERAFDFHYLRVMRIAVHVQWQQQGIGSLLLNKINGFAHNEGADFVSSSFGATSSLLSFWLTQGYHLARIGFSKDKASGEHSALVLNAISERAKNINQELTNEFYRSFSYLLTDEYRDLSADLVALILHARPNTLPIEITLRDLRNIKAFSQGHRQYSCCVFSLQLWLLKILAQSDFWEQKQLKQNQLTQSQLTQNEIGILIKRILQKHSIKEVCTEYSLTGKKALEQNIQRQISLFDVT